MIRRFSLTEGSSLFNIVGVLFGVRTDDGGLQQLRDRVGLAERALAVMERLLRAGGVAG